MRNKEKLGEFSLDLYYDDIRNAYVAKLHNGLFKYRPRHLLRLLTHLSAYGGRVPQNPLP